MELKSLILGMGFSLGIFALKSGVGLYYCLAGTDSRRGRALARGIFALAYLLVFAASGAVLKHLAEIDPGGRLPLILTWMESGMWIHLLMAALLLVWGLRLTLGNGADGGRSRSWLLPALPCPVCATVIALSMGFLAARFPDAPAAAAAGLYLAFLAVSMITAALMAVGETAAKSSPDALLGGAMLFIAAYFLLSVIILPNVADIDAVYRMAATPGQDAPAGIRHGIIFTTAAAATFLGGFSAGMYNIRRTA